MLKPLCRRLSILPFQLFHYFFCKVTLHVYDREGTKYKFEKGLTVLPDGGKATLATWKGRYEVVVGAPMVSNIISQPVNHALNIKYKKLPCTFCVCKYGTWFPVQGHWWRDLVFPRDQQPVVNTCVHINNRLVCAWFSPDTRVYCCKNLSICRWESFWSTR